ncbi:hypothetical protein RE6C_05921 [Rhodopirellula europaea 6C]|uniref:Uncharacterized protein n=1 Tax=Rhodopirellula europaea 6C TaxID=1263867 RepID=M2AUZ3_9BACT|nr:hypothetical protein RE6C_05921 [Rhodopirellula europaea 6C]
MWPAIATFLHSRDTLASRKHWFSGRISPFAFDIFEKLHASTSNEHA